jgi:hypothetical protein
MKIVKFELRSHPPIGVWAMAELRCYYADGGGFAGPVMSRKIAMKDAFTLIRNEVGVPIGPLPEILREVVLVGFGGGAWLDSLSESKKQEAKRLLAAN